MPLSRKNPPPTKASPLSNGGASGLLSALPLPAAIFTNGKAPALLWVNPAWSASFSRAILSQGSLLEETIAKVAETQSGITLHDHDLGGVRCEQVMVFAFDNQHVGVVAVPNNANHRFDAAEQARNALRPAGLMARMLAHEIRNPLAGIQAAGQLMLKKLRKDDSDRQLAELVVSESQRIGRLVDKMTVFDDDTPPKLSAINLHAPLEQAAATTAAAFPALQIIRRFDPSLPDINAHHDQLVQVFVNLMKNAAEADADRLVLGTAYHLGAGVIHPRSLEKLPLRITVEDNGAGMSDETRGRLFEAYYTTKATGQGFGLAIAAKIIDDHGGIIEVTDSKPGATIIEIYLPILPKADET